MALVACLASVTLSFVHPPVLEPRQAVSLGAAADSARSSVLAEEAPRSWHWASPEAPHSTYELRRAEGTVMGLPVFLYAMLRELGLRPNQAVSGVEGLGPRDFSGDCSRRDPRCQSFHDDYGSNEHEASYLGIGASVVGGATGGAVRLGEVDRAVAPEVKWEVHPRFMGIEGSF